jgi:replication factor C subunit 1
LNYEVFELNASDARNKKSLDAQVAQVTQTQLLNFGGGNKIFAANGTRKKKRLIVMDEVDGMSSGDRGGMAELIKIIKKSKVPIICICNDRQSQKVRSLANHTLDLRFMRPQSRTIAKRMCDIASREGLNVAPNAMEALIEQTGNDIRQVLNALQMWRAEAAGSDDVINVSYNDMKKRMNTVQKDGKLRLNPFDCAAGILNPGKRTLNERMDMFFVDYDLMPLLIQQNYISSVKNCNRDPLLGNLHRMADAAMAVSDADLAMVMVRSEQRWDLLTKAAAMNVRVGSISQAPITAYASFPEWLGKNSSKSKRSRILNELSTHLGHRSTGNTSAIRLDYFGFLRDHVLNPMVEKQKDGIKESVAIMEEYSLTRDDVFETFKDFHLPKPGREKAVLPHERLKSATKSGFTRYFNKNVKITPEMLHGGKLKPADQQKMLIKKQSTSTDSRTDMDGVKFKKKRKKKKGK